jgi:hypothetical protein
MENDNIRWSPGEFEDSVLKDQITDRVGARHAWDNLYALTFVGTDPNGKVRLLPKGRAYIVKTGTQLENATAKR